MFSMLALLSAKSTRFVHADGSHGNHSNSDGWVKFDDAKTELAGGDNEENMICYYLEGEVILKSSNIIVSSGHVMLCLNGNILRSEVEELSIITIKGDASFTLCDCKHGVEEEQYAHKYYMDESDIYVFSDSADALEMSIIGTIYGGVITGGTGTNVNYEDNLDDNYFAYFGGGVYVESGTFTMTGGTIAGNSAINAGTYYGYGGGVYAYASGAFKMTGGIIFGNKADYGGGIYLCGTINATSGEISGNTANNSGGGAYIAANSELIMSGGEISGNTAPFGGGIYIDSGTLTITAGTVSGNSADYGGGAYLTGGTIKMSGTPQITGNANSNSEADNVYFNSGGVITIAGTLKDGAVIGVYVPSVPYTITSGFASNNISSTEPSYFISDQGYKVVLSDGEVIVYDDTAEDDDNLTWILKLIPALLLAVVIILLCVALVILVIKRKPKNNEYPAK